MKKVITAVLLLGATLLPISGYSMPEAFRHELH